MRRAWIGILSLAFCPIAVASARSAPDLAIGFLLDPPSALARGQHFDYAMVVRNSGHRRTRRTQTGIYLSQKTRFDATAVRVALRATRRLPPGASTLLGTEIDVPADLPAGRYFVIVCADATHRVHESNERNCVGSASDMVVQPAT